MGDDKKNDTSDRLIDGDPEAGVPPLAELAKRVDDNKKSNVERHLEDVKKAEAKGLRW